VCHGAKGGGNGPISGKIGAVANLQQPMYIEMADGTMFHSLTYGRNNMGSYASQLSREQRWKIIQYVRTLQPKATTPAASIATTATTTAAKDTTTKASGTK
jgi:mono/diheme cytochrome c family protein